MARREELPDATLAAVRGLFALFGAALAALHGPGAAASNAASGLQLEEMLRLAEHWSKVGSAQGAAAEEAAAGARAGPAERPASNVVPLAAAGAAQGRETS